MVLPRLTRGEHRFLAQALAAYGSVIREAAVHAEEEERLSHIEDAKVVDALLAKVMPDAKDRTRMAEVAERTLEEARPAPARERS